MKKLLSILIIVIILSLGGCSNNKDIEKNDTYFYVGQSKTWLVTYTVTKVKSSYYDSLYIQYIFDDSKIEDETRKIGPIEYQLKGNLMELKSSNPQELKGVANFHTGSRMNADVIKITFDEEIELNVKWQGKSETIKLKIQN